MKEAVNLLNDVSAAVSYARKYASVHHGIYLDILENDKSADADSMVSIGIHAMDTIPKNFMIRSEAALKTAEYVIRANAKQSLLEMCYFAACESDTSAVNYIRALLNGYGTEQKRGELRKVFMTTNGSRDSHAIIGRSYTGSEREENRLDKNRLLLLRFLDGQFADVLMEGLSESKALGWTGTFMKQGIALYLLYLYEGEQLGQGMSAMADVGKTAMNFSKKESRGDFGAKQRLMTSYKDKYSRRSAFRAELEAYGWINIKKKS